VWWAHPHRTLDAVVKILRTEGPLGMFKGIGAHYLRIGPHTFFTLLFWEHIKRFFHSQ
jgi:solute carrier family 25 protein 34/35